ncbi:MAG: hypothetical protein HOV81_12855 [Kofleriaceae bacterium]|nr:hypothetical protein [Kofleriaceae bacterium]
MRDEDRLELDDDDRALVDRLRRLPPEGEEPDWQKLAAAIRAEVGTTAPKPWWRSWQWLVPIGALAATAALAFIVLERRTHDEPTPSPPPVVRHEMPPAPAPAASESTLVWLDGEAVELDDDLAPALDELDEEARRALRTDELDVTGGILPASNLSWVDELDETDLASAEQWLARKKT